MKNKLLIRKYKLFIKIKKKMTNTLTNEQEECLNLMLSNYNVFLTGNAGTGKSYILKEYINYIKKLKLSKKVAITSTTGVSALLIGGKTLHSWAGIGLGTGNLYKKVTNNVSALFRWRNIKTLIIDEISMLDYRLFDKLNILAKRIKNEPDKPFGGIQIIAVGDFCQLPVVKGNGNFCFESASWNECRFHIVNLKQVIRQDNIEFKKMLQEIRFGNVSNNTRELLNSRVGLWNFDTSDKNGIKPTLLYSTNKDINAINDAELEKLYKLGHEIINYKVKKLKHNLVTTTEEYILDVNISNNDLYKREFETYKRVTEDIKEIRLAVNAQVMLTKNLDIDSGLVNGSRGIITDFKFIDTNTNYKNKIKFPVITFTNGVTRIIEPYIYEYIDDEFEIIYSQLPIKLAWATTIHKSQGATLSSVVINLSNIFEYGQAYVALSRVSDINSMYLVGDINYNKICAHPKACEFYEQLCSS